MWVNISVLQVFGFQESILPLALAHCKEKNDRLQSSAAKRTNKKQQQQAFQYRRLGNCLGNSEECSAVAWMHINWGKGVAITGCQGSGSTVMIKNGPQDITV